jgi:hypothetical protein
MPNLNNPNPTNEATELPVDIVQGSSEAIGNAKQDKLSLISKLENSELKTLAKEELQELEALEIEKT